MSYKSQDERKANCTTMSHPSHILLIFSSEPPQNLSPSNNILFKSPTLTDKNIFRKAGHAFNKILHFPKQILNQWKNKYAP